MVEIIETDMDDEYLQCSSCLKSNEDDVNIFRIVIGKNYRQTTCIKLCEECMRDLKIDMNSLEINGDFRHKTGISSVNIQKERGNVRRNKRK